MRRVILDILQDTSNKFRPTLLIRSCHFGFWYFVTLIGLFSFSSCLAKCKQRLRNIFVCIIVTSSSKTKNWMNKTKVVILFHEKDPSQDFITKTLALNWQYLLHVTLNFCGNCIKARRYYVWPMILHSLYVTLQQTYNNSCKVQRYFFNGTTLKWFG